jgi:CRP-like cAMP-binding protein
MPFLPSLHHMAVMSSDWLSALPDTVREDILRRGKKRELASGERLRSRGDQPDGMYGILQGAVRVSGVSREGRETILDFYPPGSWIGESSTLDGGPCIHDMEGYGPTVVLHISPEDLEELLAIHPSFSRSLLRLIARRLRLLFVGLEAYSSRSLEHRLANRLLMLAGSFGVGAPTGLKIDLHLPQETIAQLIVSTRQRVNQILRRWELENVIQQEYGRMVLLDRIRLEKIARE